VIKHTSTQNFKTIDEEQCSMPISLAYARDHQVSGSESPAMRGRTLNYTGKHI